MKEAAKITLYVASVLLLGALLAPLLWHAGRWAVETDLIPQLRRVGFARYFNRAVLVAALVLLVPFIRWIGVRSWRELGLRSNPRRGMHMLVGFALGALGLAVAGALIVLSDRAELRAHFNLTKIALALVTGVVVGVLEETFFRGAVFGVVRRELRWPWALAFVTVFFAVLHFLKPDPAATKGLEVVWWSGLHLVPHVFWRFQDPQALLGSFLTLVLVGWTLGYAVVRTDSLYLAIGLHAGWVFALKSFSVVTKRGAASASIWLGRDPIVGLVPLALVGLTLLVLIVAFRHRRAGPGSVSF